MWQKEMHYMMQEEEKDQKEDGEAPSLQHP